MILVGAIDPGKKGGWAVYDRATRTLIEAGRLDFDDPMKLARQLTGCEEILIERAQASAQMGVSSSFEYGRGFGRIEAAAMSTGAVIYYCAPAWWKGRLAVPVDKEKAVLLALKRVPELSPYIRLKSDDGVAEAALMGQILLSNKLFSELELNNKKRTAPKKKKNTYRL